MNIGRGFIAFGLLLIVVGALLLFFPKIFSWFGNLPGDLKFGSKDSRVYIPITSMILISVILTLLVNGIHWIMSFFSNMK